MPSPYFSGYISCLFLRRLKIHFLLNQSEYPHKNRAFRGWNRCNLMQWNLSGFWARYTYSYVNRSRTFKVASASAETGLYAKIHIISVTVKWLCLMTMHFFIINQCHALLTSKADPKKSSLILTFFIVENLVLLEHTSPRLAFHCVTLYHFSENCSLILHVNRYSVDFIDWQKEWHNQVINSFIRIICIPLV